jgi:GNAT superfamily N-acetyltransferase
MYNCGDSDVFSDTTITAAWVRFEYPHTSAPTVASTLEGQNAGETQLAGMSLPAGANYSLMAALFGKFGKIKEKHFDPEKMYCKHSSFHRLPWVPTETSIYITWLTRDLDVSGLCTLPEYQKRGLGRLLMERGLNDAERDGAKTFLLASPVAKPFYHNLGFKDLEEHILDWRDLGATGTRTTTAQMLDPNK